jgi:outer membrane lipoprotein-sorting protein
MGMNSRARSISLVGLLSLVLCSAASAQDGLELFHKMQEAMGGAEKIAAIRDYEDLVHAQTWNYEGKLNGPERKRTRWLRPNYLRVDQVGHDNNTYVLYFDGSSGWEILPDKEGVLPLVGDELKFAQNYLSGMDLKIWLHDHDPRYRFATPSKNVIRISDKEDVGNEKEITLDPVTSLPLKQANVFPKDQSQPGPTETRYEEWKAVQGIQFPQRITMIKNGAPVAVITVDEIKLDNGMNPADLAKKPADLNPVISLTPLGEGTPRLKQAPTGTPGNSLSAP